MPPNLFADIYYVMQNIFCNCVTLEFEDVTERREIIMLIYLTKCAMISMDEQLQEGRP